jgi:hypothetical protein
MGARGKGKHCCELTTRGQVLKNICPDKLYTFRVLGDPLRVLSVHTDAPITCFGPRLNHVACTVTEG